MKKLFIPILLFVIIYLQAHPGIGIVEDSKGNIFYTDLKQVWKIDVTGAKSIAVKNVHTHELYLDEHDNLFGEHLWYNGEKTNTWAHYVWRFSASGKFEKIIPDTEGFLQNYSFVRDHFGRMYWANSVGPCQKLIRTNRDKTITRLSKECLHNVRWMKSTELGDVYFVDELNLKRVDRKGNISTLTRKTDSKDPNALMGIWNDSQENIYLAVYSERAVKKFGPNGKEEIAASISFPWGPSGGLVDAKGNLWVLEADIANRVRVERISKNGERKVF